MLNNLIVGGLVWAQTSSTSDQVLVQPTICKALSQTIRRACMSAFGTYDLQPMQQLSVLRHAGIEARHLQ